MSKSYMEQLGEISSSAKTAKQAADIVAAMAPPPVDSIQGAGDTVAVTKPAESSPSVGKSIAGLAPGVAGGALGAVVWKKHRVLGFLAGHAVGANAKALYSGDRTGAMCRVAIEGSGVAGALLLKKRMHPVFGWMLGVAAGAVATSFVKNSPMKHGLKGLWEMI